MKYLTEYRDPALAERLLGEIPRSASWVVPSWSIHRIQETHTLLVHVLWDELHVAPGEADVL